MVEPRHPDLSLSRQCQLVGISRSSIYYQQRPARPDDLEMMRLIDKQYLKTPFYGSRSMAKHLRRLGQKSTGKEYSA